MVFANRTIWISKDINCIYISIEDVIEDYLE